LVREVTPRSAAAILSELGGSHGTDVTGGMLTKVMAMCELVAELPSVSVQIVSGEELGLLTEVLMDPEADTGTVIRSDEPKVGF
jgi:isopentenyl phosphate kinase